MTSETRTWLAGIMVLVLMGTGAWGQTEAKGTVQFARKHLAINPHEGCAIADLNRDGHQDIVYGPYIFYGPDFPMQTFRPNHVSEGYIHANSDHVHDVDKDGWLDVITCAWGKEGIIWYKNPGNSAKERGEPWNMHLPWESHVLTTSRGRMEMFVTHDYDGDGVPEFHGCCYGREEPLEIWRFTKTAAGEPALAAFVLGAQGGGHGVAFGDVNGDGREDVLCEIGWYERPAGDIFAGPWKYHEETNLNHMHPSCPFVATDLNKDGRLDIIFGRAHDYGLYWWEQLAPDPDGKTKWKQHVIDESWSQVHMVELADLDADGQKELISGKCIWAHNAGDPGAADPVAVYYYSWDAKSAKWTRHTIADIGENIALGRQMAMDDLNKDGRNDIVATSKMGLWVFMNEGYK